jgi:hypothetical protein
MRPGFLLERNTMEKDDPHLYTFRKVLGRHQGEGIECRFCNLTSFHPNDIENRYCGYCDIFHDDISEVLTRAVAGELPREWGIRWPHVAAYFSNDSAAG